MAKDTRVVTRIYYSNTVGIGCVVMGMVQEPEKKAEQCRTNGPEKCSERNNNNLGADHGFRFPNSPRFNSDYPLLWLPPPCEWRAILGSVSSEVLLPRAGLNGMCRGISPTPLLREGDTCKAE